MRLIELHGDPRPIAIARMGLGVATIFNAAEMCTLLLQIAAGKLALPVTTIMPAPTAIATYAYLVLAVLAGAAVAAGWRTASAAVVSTLLNVWVFLWDQQTYSSHRLLATLLVAYLIFAKSDAVWSVARREGSVPWWPQLLMMTQISVCYFFAAISKVNITFMSGVGLSQWVWAELPRWMFALMGTGTIVVELFLALGLWFRSTRRVAVLLGLLLHGSIVVLMKEQTVPLISFAVTCVSLYGLFVIRPTFASKTTTDRVPAP